MRSKLIILGAFFALIAILVVARLAYIADRTRNDKVVQTLIELSTQNLLQVTITPAPFSQKQFHTAVSEETSLHELAKLLSRSDTRGVAGHDGSIYEWTVTFATSSGSRVFLASAHHSDP